MASSHKIYWETSRSNGLDPTKRISHLVSRRYLPRSEEVEEVEVNLFLLHPQLLWSNEANNAGLSFSLRTEERTEDWEEEWGSRARFLCWLHSRLASQSEPPLTAGTAEWGGVLHHCLADCVAATTTLHSYQSSQQRVGNTATYHRNRTTNPA